MHENKQLRQTRRQQNEGIIPSSLALWNTACIGVTRRRVTQAAAVLHRMLTTKESCATEIPATWRQFHKKTSFSPPPPAVIVHCFYNLGDRDSCQFHELPECLNSLCFSASFKEKSFVMHHYLTYLPGSEYLTSSLTSYCGFQDGITNCYQIKKYYQCRAGKRSDVGPCSMCFKVLGQFGVL